MSLRAPADDPNNPPSALLANEVNQEIKPAQKCYRFKPNRPARNQGRAPFSGTRGFRLDSIIIAAAAGPKPNSLTGRSFADNSISPKCNHNLGDVLVSLGRLDEAIAAFRRALEINPEYAEAAYNLGHALYATGRDDAFDAFQRAIAIRAEFVEAHFMLGQALMRADRIDEAAAAFERAIEINPEFVEARLALGIAELEQGDHRGAGAEFRRALEIRPRYAEAAFNLGQAEHEMGNFNDALAAYHRAIEVEPGYALAWVAAKRRAASPLRGTNSKSRRSRQTGMHWATGVPFASTPENSRPIQRAGK